MLQIEIPRDKYYSHRREPSPTPTGRKVSDLGSHLKRVYQAERVAAGKKITRMRSHYAHQLTMLQYNITRLEIVQRKPAADDLAR